jgi:hypothetical protein
VKAGLPDNRIWAGAAAAGVFAIVILALLVRVPEPPLKLVGTTPPTVGMVDPVVTMATLLRDPTPLFLPTRFNSSRIDYVPSEPGGAFAGFQPKLSFAEAELDLRLPSSSAIPASPAEALAGDPPGAPFLGFGRREAVVQPLSRRTAYVEIHEAGSGRTVFGQAVTDTHPPASSLPWQPMEFMAAVDAAGLVGPLVPTARSGVDDVDSYFGRYLADSLRVGQRLAPGFYRIIVGP